MVVSFLRSSARIHGDSSTATLQFNQHVLRPARSVSEEKKSFSPFLSSWIRNKGKINSALSLVEDARRADVLFVGFHRGKTPRSKVTFLLEKKTESAILLRSNRSELFASAQQKRESDEIEGVAFISPSVHFGISDDFQRHVKNPDERFQEATRKKMSPSFRRRSLFFCFSGPKNVFGRRRIGANASRIERSERTTSSGKFLSAL